MAVIYLFNIYLHFNSNKYKKKNKKIKPFKLNIKQNRVYIQVQFLQPLS